VRKDPDAEPITRLVDYEAFCGIAPVREVDGDHAVDARTLSRMLADRDAGKRDFQLIDVREPGEYEVVSIPGAVVIPKGRILSGEALDDLPREQDLVFHCKSGGRSSEVLESLLAQGYTRVSHLDGGILAWVRDVEPAKPVY